jgi:hypothetical protein
MRIQPARSKANSSSSSRLDTNGELQSIEETLKQLNGALQASVRRAWHATRILEALIIGEKRVNHET